MGSKRIEYGEKRGKTTKKKTQTATSPVIPPPPKLQTAAPTEALTGIVTDKQHQHYQNPTDTNPYVFVGESVSVCDIISLDVPLRRGGRNDAMQNPQL